MGSSSRGAIVLVCLLAAFVAAPRRAHAQAGTVQEENGFQPNRDYLSLQAWESIDTANGNIILTFTDLVLPGNNGHELRFERTFNNLITKAGQVSRWRFGISGVPMKVTIPNVPTGVAIS